MTATIISSIILLSNSLGGMILLSATGQIVEQLGAPMMTWLVSASLVGNILMFMLLRLRKANNPQPARSWPEHNNKPAKPIILGSAGLLSEFFSKRQGTCHCFRSRQG